MCNSARGPSVTPLLQTRSTWYSHTVTSSVIRLNGVGLNIISSVTSIKIEKITLNHTAMFLCSVSHTFWTELNDILIKLIEWSEYQQWLEVEFQGTIRKVEVNLFTYPTYFGLFWLVPCHLDALKMSKLGLGLFNINKLNNHHISEISATPFFWWPSPRVRNLTRRHLPNFAERDSLRPSE